MAKHCPTFGLYTIQTERRDLWEKKVRVKLLSLFVIVQLNRAGVQAILEEVNQPFEK